MHQDIDSGSSFSIADIFVVAGGLVTTVLTLGIVMLLNATIEDLNIMGWYAVFIIPAGAILVGAGAGSGYGLVSWVSGRKVGGLLLATVLLIQLVAYCGAQWLEFRSLDFVHENGTPVSFFEYFDATTRSMTFTFRHSSNPTGELGIVGYLFRGLELLGFALGGLVIPGMLKAKPYCEGCRTYMRTRSIGLIPASEPARKIGKKDVEAQRLYEEAMSRSLEEGLASAKNISDAAASHDASTIRQVIETHAAEKAKIGKLLHRIEISLSACPRCHDGLIALQLHSGHGDKIQTRELARTPITAAVTRSL